MRSSPSRRIAESIFWCFWTPSPITPSSSAAGAGAGAGAEAGQLLQCRLLEKSYLFALLSFAFIHWISCEQRVLHMDEDIFTFVYHTNVKPYDGLFLCLVSLYKEDSAAAWLCCQSFLVGPWAASAISLYSIINIYMSSNCGAILRQSYAQRTSLDA